MDNSLIALLVAVCVDRGLVQGNINFTRWNRALNSAGLRSEMWLFAYESVGLGINPSDSTAFIEQDEYFSLLFKRGVRFLSIESGFTSIGTTLRSLRDQNSRLRRIRDDFAEDLEIDTEELDEDDEEGGDGGEGKGEVEDVGY